MTRRELTLLDKGYTYRGCQHSHSGAKEKAQSLRAQGYRATILIESRGGINYYSVWSKKKEEEA